MLRSYRLLFLVAAALPAAAQSTGVSTEWDVRKLLVNLAQQTQHLQSVLDQIKPDTWVANGAPQTYVTQWNTAHAELKYLLGSTDALAKQPEKLTAALDAYFRMQAMGTTLGSVIEGIRKYQNPAVADLLQAVVNENSANRDRLRQYVQDLATQKEQEFQVADREAQRCRAMLLKEPAPNKSGRSKPK